jgi:hypothetical protein
LPSFAEENERKLKLRLHDIFSKFVGSRIPLLAILIALPVILGLQSYYNSVNYKGASCRHYSNYQVFKYAHYHLLSDQDLYSDHLKEHCFTFKYSPSFALFFGLFAYLPDWMGLVLWMLLSGIVSYFAIRSLPGMAPPKQFLFFLFIFFEWLGSVQGQQTNALIAMLLLSAFSLLERNKPLPATLLIVLTGFIKIFGFGAILLLIFYPQKWKLAVYTMVWSLILAVLPLVVISPDELWGIYESWYSQVLGDFSQYKGMSIYSLVEKLSGWAPPKQFWMMGSLILMIAPLIQLKKWKELWFRKFVLSAILIWVVVFNHKAESHTYVIAMVGIGFWYFAVPRKWFDTGLIIFALAGISLLYSDIVPRSWKGEFPFDFHVKALPSAVLWLRVVLDLWVYRNQPFPKQKSSAPAPLGA